MALIYSILSAALLPVSAVPIWIYIISCMASRWGRLSCTMGEARQDARPKLAALVPPSAQPLLPPVAMLGWRSATLGQSGVGACVHWELQSSSVVFMLWLG